MARPDGGGGPGCSWDARFESAGCCPVWAGRVAASFGAGLDGSVVFGDDVFAPWAGRWPVVQLVYFSEGGL